MGQTFRCVAASDAASDIIYDFVSGSDPIGLSIIDANTAQDGNQAFTFIGSNAFGNQAGRLRVQASDGVAHILAYNLVAPLGASDVLL
jgi:hypothetical protein